MLKEFCINSYDEKKGGRRRKKKSWIGNKVREGERAACRPKREREIREQKEDIIN